MITIITNSNKKNYNLKPNLEEEIEQNILNIVTRIQGNVPLNREKGISTEYVDSPSEEVKQLIVSELIEEIEREEPRFEIEDIEFLDENYGSVLNMKITGYIKEVEV